MSKYTSESDVARIVNLSPHTLVNPEEKEITVGNDGPGIRIWGKINYLRKCGWRVEQLDALEKYRTRSHMRKTLNFN